MLRSGTKPQSQMDSAEGSHLPKTGRGAASARGAARGPSSTRDADEAELTGQAGAHPKLTQCGAHSGTNSRPSSLRLQHRRSAARRAASISRAGRVPYSWQQNHGAGGATLLPLAFERSWRQST